jgi:hypothetical protein
MCLSGLDFFIQQLIDLIQNSNHIEKIMNDEKSICYSKSPTGSEEKKKGKMPRLFPFRLVFECFFWYDAVHSFAKDLI